MPTRKIFSGEFKRKSVQLVTRFSKTNILEYRTHSAGCWPHLRKYHTQYWQIGESIYYTAPINTKYRLPSCQLGEEI